MGPLDWIAIAAGLSAGVDWRRLGLVCLALTAPIPAGVIIGCYGWRQRPRLSMRAPRFCDAIVGELRSGASLRGALGLAAGSVDADEVARLCRLGASMTEISSAARIEFPDIGDELAAVLARAERAGGSPVHL